jgi:subtilisin family serine protease
MKLKAYYRHIGIAFGFALAIAGCGGGGRGGSAPATYALGGTVTGLAGTLVLQNNGADNLTVAANGTFTFATRLGQGASYRATVISQPAGQVCAVANGSGTVAGANVTNIQVDCRFTIGATVTGLLGTGLVLQNNGGDNLNVSANGSFTFATGVPSGGSYSVGVLTAPSNPTQVCAVTNGNGTVASASITNIRVECGFAIGGTVTGLSGSVVLQNNAADNLTVSANGAFTFSKPVPNAGTYSVTVLTQPNTPTLQFCTVTNGSGTVSGANVTNVAVACKNAFSIGTLLDPLAVQQWHLLNTGQTGYADTAGVAGMDINADPTYRTAATGSGTIAAVVDTGMEIAHEDLSANVVQGGSWNFNTITTNPTNTIATTGDHGTSVAGLIAAAKNTVGGIGVAPSAKLKGFNFLSSTQMTAQWLASIGGSTANPNSSDVHVFNQSFGTSNTSDFLIDPTIEAQYASGATTLRSGKGALYVKSAGNGFSGFGVASCVTANNAGLSCQNANFDPVNTIPYQIVVGATNASGIKSSYSTAGSAIWVSAPGGEFGMNSSVAPGLISAAYQPAMVTVDQSGCTIGYSRTGANTSVFNNGGAPNTSCNYTNTFNGTSSAAPVTSGAIALILEANPALTWRDVKHILAKTARKIDATRPAVSVTLSNGSYVAEPAWIVNAAGNTFHNWYGFGMVDASAAVNMARAYALGSLGTSVNTGFIASAALALAIPDNSVTGATSTLTVPAGTVSVIEAVQIRVSATHTFTGDLAIELTSPAGTRSVLKNGRDGFTNHANLSNMVLQSNAFYGEPAAGIWTIKLVDTEAPDTGSLTSWAIRIYGH